MIFKGTEKLQGRFMKHALETPFGVAAGPHTQMAQNIIAAWLCGARYIELKTVQVLDELEIPKPCIDMADEGYNCEWSQELRIEQSFNEYLNAWIMLHVLNYKINSSQAAPGVIFNMSVGYNYEGVLNKKVQWFLDKMKNCSKEKQEKINSLSTLFPDITKINIPDCISDNVTLSTMHGCPPDEIEKITRYLVEERKLNTVLKLNPTLLGKDDVRNILNNVCGFYSQVPDEAFEHDLKYPQAIDIIKKLILAAEQNKVFFGVKLTNTLESLNTRDVFTKEQPTMYMSGRALHPVSINLAKKLSTEFNGTLPISFSAGADCFNMADVLSCGLYPVTVSSDILKPGGYGRLLQYTTEIEKAFNAAGAESRETFIEKKASEKGPDTQAALTNLEGYAQYVLESKFYKKEPFFEKNIKTSRNLHFFDCINAPCTQTCPTHQDIPEYMYYAAEGNFNEAFRTILRTNPFPNVLGMVCDHKCQTKCTRVNYDEVLRIRDVKWFISENNNNSFREELPLNGIKVAIIGAGPSGLSCAYFLRLAGVEVTVYESKSISGGMVSEAIPRFRLKEKALQKDIDRIKNLGVHIHYNAKIDPQSFGFIKNEYNYIYIAVGAQKIKKLNIPGDNAEGIIDPIEFLSSLKRNAPLSLGKKIAVVGGGNTAVDVARAVLRMVKDKERVTLVYRRTLNDMPAEKEEIEALLEEGINVIELTQPVEVIAENNRVKGLKCIKMQLSGKDTAGRSKIIAVPDSEHLLHFDTIIPALGQDTNIDFLTSEELESVKQDKDLPAKIFIGGDAYRGASTIVNAVADGKNSALKVIDAINYRKGLIGINAPEVTYENLIEKRAARQFSVLPKITMNQYEADAPELPYSEKQIMAEASRCLLCNQLCNICVTVCPNKANYSYKTEPCTLILSKVRIDNNKPVIEKDKEFSVKQKYQIINIADFCNECGNCRTFCPTADAPYTHKPKFYLTAESFRSAPEGFYFSNTNAKKALIYKKENAFITLSMTNGQYVYETDLIKAFFSHNDFTLMNVDILKPFEGYVMLDKAAEMLMLFKAAQNLY